MLSTLCIECIPYCAAQLSTEKDGKLKNIDDPKIALTPAAIFPGDTAELETEIREFERKVDAKKKLVDDVSVMLDFLQLF